jgi:hypothetical protein
MFKILLIVILLRLIASQYSPDIKINHRMNPPSQADTIMNLDKIGKWTTSPECYEGTAVYMRKIEIPFLIYTPTDIFYHHTLEFEVICEDGSETNYSLDFTSTNGTQIKKRFGYFNEKIKILNETKISLKIRLIETISETDKKYKLVKYNCHNYSNDIYDKIMFEDCRLNQRSTTETPKISRGCNPSMPIKVPNHGKYNIKL